MLKQLATAVAEFYRTDRGLRFYAGTGAVLAVALFINYSAIVDLQWATKDDGPWVWLGHYLALYGGLYYASALLGANGASKQYLRDPWFWLLSVVFVMLAILPKLRVFALVSGRDHPDWNAAEFVFAYNSLFFVQHLVITGIGLLALRFVLSRWMTFDFGLRWNQEQVGSYLLILLAISPLIVSASFLPVFQEAYPQYKPWAVGGQAFGLSEGTRTTLFLLSYAQGFIAVELLFRGAMAIAMFRLMGIRAVLPMAALYCAFHFDKPAGEAIGSIFAAYLLGILALHSRSISGGIIIHLGAALLMELMGHLHHALR